MASITIRNLDEAVKQALRERAAANGRSMEEEVRLLLAGQVDARTGEMERGADAVAAAVPEDLNQLGQAGFPSPPVSAPHAAVKQTSAETASTGHQFDFPAAGKRIVLIITGGIAAYKSLDLIRRLRERGVHVRPVMTAAAQQFITPLSVGALAADKVFSELFDREDEQDVGHIRLARDCDLVVVAPATADLMAKVANGLADDLASTVLMATDRPILMAPAMNPVMWASKATQRNVKTLHGDGVHFLGPASGEMAEADEAGRGRMAEPMQIVDRIGELLDTRPKPLRGKRAVVTSGPTHEPIDPVRYIANRSSGKQGHAIAAALAELGAEVILVSGPVSIPDPYGCEVVRVETAREMQRMVEAALPADIAVMVAAVADWRSRDEASQKMKKENGKGPSHLELTENPDILKGIGHGKRRPKLLIGFAAETQDLIHHGKAKLQRKNADWIIANDVSADSGIGEQGVGVMGGDRNRVKIVTRNGVEALPEMTKRQVAMALAQRIAAYFSEGSAVT